MTKKDGFTLIEVLIVVFIIGLLASLALPNLMSALYKGRAAKVVEDMRIIRDSLTDYHLDKNIWPKSRGWGKIPRGVDFHLPPAISFDLTSWQTRYAFTNYSNKSQDWRDKRGYTVILRSRIDDIRLANAVYTLAPQLFNKVTINKKRGIFIIILE
jgi:prepilin-type N-terminal cleavage/methylation domain-containing protein